MSTVPLSVLDLAPIAEGSTARQALHNTLDLARRAEAWGYRRYWVAEHHFVAVASSSPAVLAGAIAAATSRIRVGVAAVQLGYTTAAAIAESFGTLEALHPGRIDLGIGRSGQREAEAAAARAGDSPARRQPPVPRATRIVDGVVVPPPVPLDALFAAPRTAATFGVLQQAGAASPDFETQVDDILAFFRGEFRTREGVAFEATPATGEHPELWVFGSSAGPSAALAGRLGLPFGANYHVSPSSTLDAVAAYRDAFRPSSVLAEPYVVVSADVVVADSDDRARELAATYGHWAYSIRCGEGARPYPDPSRARALTAAEEAVVADRLVTQFVGTGPTVVERLEALRTATGADELVVTSMTHDHRDRLRSFELLARAWGL